MRPECIKAVTQAIGRPLNQQEIKGIEDRVRRNMRQLAQTDATWQAKSVLHVDYEQRGPRTIDFIQPLRPPHSRNRLIGLCPQRPDQLILGFGGSPSNASQHQDGQCEPCGLRHSSNDGQVDRQIEPKPFKAPKTSACRHVSHW